VIKINRSGWLYIALTIFLGVAAINTANNLLYLIVAALLSFMGISGFFGKRNLSKLDIRIHPPDEVYAGIEIPIPVTLINQRRFFPTFIMRVNFGGQMVRFPFMAPRQQSTKFLPLIFDRRGRLVLSDLYLSSVFPFNFFIRFRKIPREVSLVILPHPIRCDENTGVEAVRMHKGELAVDRIGFDPDILSLRNYLVGDPLRYIHWKASARAGTLKTKEFSSSGYPPVIFNFDDILIRNLEFKLSCITYLIITFMNKNRPVGLKIQDKIFEPGLSRGHRIRMLHELALYGES
jgi:uncharacterized protein (DUF58 family)